MTDDIEHLSPLVKWSGGKKTEIAIFKKYFPSPNRYDTYIECFVGGGAVFFYLNPQNAIINDIHPELVTFYREIGKGNGQSIHDFMEEHKNDEATYYQVRDEMKTETDLDVAKRFYYLRKTCFRGMLRYNKEGKFNIPFGRYKSINYFDMKEPEYQELLSRTVVENKSFEDIFAENNNKRNFMFLDPPYMSTFSDYGFCNFGEEEHIKLSELFKSTKNKCLMVIGKTDFISELYKDYIVGEYDKKYKFKLHSGRVGKEINNKHLIVKNY